MGHSCRSCGRIRANEKFTGRGHRDHVCKDCQRLPRHERERSDRLDELHGFLRQSTVSAKNRKRLQILVQHPAPEVRVLAGLIAEITHIQPGPRRRMARIARNHWALFVQTVQQLPEHEWWACFGPSDFGPGDNWLWEQYQRAKYEGFGAVPCWCGSGRAYWDCCADRDERAASSPGMPPP